jgi:hypothetical protein
MTSKLITKMEKKIAEMRADGIPIEQKTEITGYCLRSYTVVVNGVEMQESEFVRRYLPDKY